MQKKEKVEEEEEQEEEGEKLYWSHSWEIYINTAAKKVQGEKK